jgi:hypothetical protein
MLVYLTSSILKYPVPASPFTVDILVELDKKFHEIVTDKLDVRGKEAVQKQLDPASMTASEIVKIRKDILHLVYGKCLFFYI